MFGVKRSEMGRRKQQPRYPFREKVLVSVAGFDEASEEWSENLSGGGMFIKTETPQPIGTIVEIEIETQGEDGRSVIHGLGEVVWTKEFRDAVNRERSGMGVRFLSFRGRGREELEKLLKRIATAQG